jgi:phycoerythrin-associated linker protein
MNIEEFFIKSVGEWNSMRSGHSLAFQEFEEIRSKIKIFPSKRNDSRVIKFLKDNSINTNAVNKTFLIDSDEYNDIFGEDIVPYMRSWNSPVGFY